ncbi:hypothetical protein C8R42DRAFT_778661 [Lentinula raphanica]|nr:hypothetical protein C8R42DRAFT_778661 [Lentinula raphanica]
MVKIPAARMVILSLSLLQMGLITSVLAAPTPAVVPVQPGGNSNAMGLLPSSVMQQSADRPRRCPVLKVSSETVTSLAQTIREEECYDFNMLLSDATAEQYKEMIGVIQKNTRSLNLPRDVTEKALMRISKYERDTGGKMAKEGVAWWFDQTELKGLCTSRTPDYSYKRENDDMYTDWLALSRAKQRLEGGDSTRERK